MGHLHPDADAKAQARPRLLVAEDNQVNQKVASAMLAKIGYRADVVANGAEAVEAISRVPYGAVLMDCQMPEMDGYEATIEIRKREEGGRRIPIIAMTAGAMEGDRERCLAVGMDDYISKPVAFDALSMVLDRWVPAADQRSDLASPRQAEPAGASDVLDPDMVTQLRGLTQDGKPDLFTELAELFLGQISTRLEVLSAAVTAADTETVKDELHALRGASGTIGATALAARCYEIEERIVSGDLNLEPAALEPLEAEFERVRDALATLFEDGEHR